MESLHPIDDAIRQGQPPSVLPPPDSEWRALYVCLACLALYAPAPIVIPAWADAKLQGYALFPVTAPIVMVAVQTWSSVSDLTSFGVLGIVLCLVALSAYGLHRGTAQWTPRSRLAGRLAFLIILLAISWLQGTFAYMLIHGLDGVAHS